MLRYDTQLIWSIIIYIGIIVIYLLILAIWVNLYCLSSPMPLPELPGRPASANREMLSPKMQRAVRVNDAQLLHLADRAQFDHSQDSPKRKSKTKAGHLYKRTSDNNKWQLRWFILYQNMMFYYETETSTRPSGVVLLEGSYCERLVLRTNNPDRQSAQHCFTISYRRENQRQYELRATTEAECVHWIDAIRDASFNKVVLQREELEQRHLHLLQVVESERTARAQYAQTCEDLAAEVAKLRAELCALKREWCPGGRSAPTPTTNQQLDALELKKIKKVQSFFRGWLCRRRWKQIVEQYIKSPHAESMRKRNSLVFRMVESEEEYVEQMEILVSCFLRPFKMAASSKKPPCSHEDVNSIFLNSETVLFLHQIFLKGLTSRMESWPTLVLGDLFDMLLPMLSIYQEYVRSHHYSLQVLTECKQGAQFAALLKRLEAKPTCQGRSLETFLTYPMHQVPRYIITLHELLAHTPHDHVERRSLQHARQQLEDLSRQMHDEVSETENLRKNLAVERMIIEGCDILLDVNQVFVRQGTLSQVCGGGGSGARGGRRSLQPRQAFLFSHHLILGTRATAGRLHLLPDTGRVPLSDAMLIEDPNNLEDDSSSVCSTSSTADNYQNRDFKIVFDAKGIQLSVHLVAASVQEKAAWTSDIVQCMENAQWTEAGVGSGGAGGDGTSLSVHPGVRSDPRLFTDDVDIRFSRALNSCKVPQIRYATPSRLLERLTDLRFLSVDFLNTFLLTYRVFTDGETVLEALRRVFYAECDPGGMAAEGATSDGGEGGVPSCELRAPSPSASASRKTSGASSVSGYGSEQSDRDYQNRNWRCSLKKFDEELREQGLAPAIPPMPKSRRSSSTKPAEEDASLLTIPKIMASSSSSETLKGPSPSSPSNLSSVTLVGSPADPEKHQKTADYTKQSDPIPSSDQNLPKESETSEKSFISPVHQKKEQSPQKYRQPESFKSPEEYPRKDSFDTPEHHAKPHPLMKREPDLLPTSPQHFSLGPDSRRSSTEQSASRRASSSDRRDGGSSSWWSAERRASADRRASSASHRSSLSHHLLQTCRREASQPRAGVVITSFRQSHRRSSTSTAAAAFAIATSASSNPREPKRPTSAPRDSVTSTAATMRVLNVLRHWVAKHSADFWAESRLRTEAANFLEDIVCSPNLLPAEHRAAAHLLRLFAREEEGKPDLKALLSPPLCQSKESIETLSALEIAEQMTYLDHQIFISIRSEEFLGQAWMKADKAERAPHILTMTRHFNQLSTLVVSEILGKTTLNGRVAAIEKWAAVADISRCLHNFNGTLQVCAAFTNTPVFRLKKTWEKVTKTSKQTIEKLQALVSSDGRFRALRDALHKCDPPCIPYLGLYLSDLSFIEEGTPNFTPEGLLNFSKMRMIAHVIREIRHFQQTPYKIEHIPKVCGYLLDPTLHLDEETQYNLSLELEPRATRVPLPQNV